MWYVFTSRRKLTERVVRLNFIVSDTVHIFMCRKHAKNCLLMFGNGKRNAEELFSFHLSAKHFRASSFNFAFGVARITHASEKSGSQRVHVRRLSVVIPVRCMWHITVKIQSDLFLIAGKNCKASQKDCVKSYLYQFLSVGKLTNRIVQTFYRFLIDLPD